MLLVNKKGLYDFFIFSFEGVFGKVTAFLCAHLLYLLPLFILGVLLSSLSRLLSLCLDQAVKILLSSIVWVSTVEFMLS